MNKIIVLGNSGFIGVNIFSCLHEKFGDRVTGFSSVSCNLLDSKSISKAFSQYQEEVTYIFASGITRLKENSRESFFDNVRMVDNFIQVIQDRGLVQHIIFLSTIDVYGNIDSSEVISEKTSINPADYYSLSKYVSEYMLYEYCKKKYIPLTILRLPGIFGPHDESKSTVNKMVNSALLYNKIKIFGDGLDTRDFIYIKDLNRIILYSLDLKPDNIINVASGFNHSINMYAKNIQIAFQNPEIMIEYSDCEESRRRKHFIFDVSLFREVFPDFSFTPFSESVIDYLKEFKNESH